MKFEVDNQQLEAFAAYLALGVLYAIDRGWVPADAGCHLALNFYEPLEDKISNPVWRIGAQLDELDAIPGSFDPGVPELMETLGLALQSHPEPVQITWEEDYPSG